MLADERIIETVGERLDREWLSDSVAGRLIVRTLDMHADGRWNDHASLLNDAEEEESRLLAALQTSGPTKGEAASIAAGCLLSLQRRWLEQQGLALRKRLEQGNLSSSEVLGLQKQALDLRRQLDNIPALLNRFTTSSRE
jgi:hypothetical protein